MSRPVVRPIWTTQDAVDTAQAFAMELHNAERGHRHCTRCDKSQLVVWIDPDGVCRNCKRRRRFGRVLFSRSRFRRARIMDALAVALLMIVMAAFGAVVVLLSPQAKADVTDPAVIAYTAAFGGIVCDVLDSHDSFPGIYGIAQGIHEDSGLSMFQAGQVIGLSVAEICPRHTGLIQRFIAAANAGAWT